MSTVPAFRTLSVSSTRTRYPAAPRRLRIRQRPRHPPKPKKDDNGFNGVPTLKFITLVSLGRWAQQLVNDRWSGNASKSQPSPGPEVLARLIDHPRLPSYEKSQVRKNRVTAEKNLLDCYPSSQYGVVLDATLPGDYYDDPDTPATDHDSVDESSTSSASRTVPC